MQEDNLILDLPNILDGEDKTSPFVNRIRKNYRHIRKWAKRTQTNCFRIYDREVPGYPVAIDFYAGRFCVHLFARSSEEDSEFDQALETTVQSALQAIFGATSNQIYWRVRTKSKETRQYEKRDNQQQFFTCCEYGVKFRVNLQDYLDTGLFLDHRETRQLVAKAAAGKRLLNLFAYTCSFSVQAAVAGAAYTKSVDMSNTYTEWGAENFRLNQLSLKHHEVVRADCLKFLGDEVSSGRKYDLIVIDPPTISRSTKMDKLFDIQVDYIELIEQALKLLEKEGTIFFSTNSRKFKFDGSFPNCKVIDISHKTLPIDFHDPKIHRCWKIVRN